MTVNFNGVVRMMGILLIVLACCFLPSLIVAMIYGESESFRSFVLTAVPCILIGAILKKITRPSLADLKARDGYLIAALGWMIASLVGAVPFVISGAIPSYVDAFFETCSGFSTTGSTILADIEPLPRSMLFWRSFTHWIGGMGIIVFIAAVLPSMGIGGQLAASAETPGPTLDKLSSRYSDTAKKLYLLYTFFTLTQTLLLVLGGMSLYDSLLHTFGTVGTGGFSAYNASISHFTNPYIHWVITVFMMLCGINFNLYFLLGKKNGIKSFFRDPELKLYLLIIFGASLLIAINLMTTGTYDSLSDCIRDSTFQVTSIITTTGYMTADYDLWPTFSKMLIFMVLLTGACSSSTGGGVKIIRILVSLKMVRRGFSLKLHPNRVVTITVGGKEVPQEVATNIANFVFCYILTAFCGFLLVSFNNLDLVTTVSSVLTCLGNAGPGFGLVGPALNFSILSDFSKLVLSLLMIAGRLELFTFFMLFSPRYWNSNKA